MLSPEFVACIIGLVIGVLVGYKLVFYPLATEERKDGGES